MLSMEVRNVSEALFFGKQFIEQNGVEVQTRNGLALEFPTPVMTTYSHPEERVLFYKGRDANPYFHLMESLWMLAGRNEVDWISQFNGRINTYSDDGEYFHGAYGFRWREWFTKDQLQIVSHRLKTYPNDRRSVVTMWDPWEDLWEENDGKDYPCNTHIYFWERKGRLNMTVCNRSNDMIWGAYGANAVHMSFLLEYMAQINGYKMGKYYQLSNNLHAYVDVLNKLDLGDSCDYEPYLTLAEDGLSYCSPPLINDPDSFDAELQKWFLGAEVNDDVSGEYKNTFLSKTASPMYRSWRAWKYKRIDFALYHAKEIHDRAWRKACIEWLERRKK